MFRTQVRQHLRVILAVLTLVLLGLPTVANAQLTRGPYVQLGTPTTTTVVWRTLLPVTGKVWYGTNAATLDTTASGASSGFQHEVLVTGLEPATRYYYAVGSGSTKIAGGDATYFFETAPFVGLSTPFRAWVVGDSGTGDLEQFAVRDSMLTATSPAGGALGTRPDIFLHMGDMAYGDGTDLEFQFRFFGIYDSILRNTVCWPTMGNHEGKSSSSADEEGPYYDAYVLPKQAQAGGVASGTEAYYSFDYSNVHFIVLDSHDTNRDPDGAMLTWLAQDLAGTSQDWIIAFWHHPPYTHGSHNSDTEGQLIEMRENALPILEAGGVDLVMGGHSHVYERSFLLDGAYDTPTVSTDSIVDGGSGKADGDGAYVKGEGANEGTVYIVAGHGGAEAKQKNPDHPLMYFTEVENGSCLLDVNGSTLTLTNLRHDGKITDYFSMIKGEGLLVTAPNGGEAWGGGQSVDITWTTSGDIPAVDIHLSLDGGSNWSALTTGLTNIGQWTWDIPGAAAESALIRVRDSSEVTVADQSDAPFVLSWLAPLEVIEWGDTWRYHDQLADPGVDWMAEGYNDGSWAVGEAQLGFGDGDETTELQDTDPNLASYYFRHTFDFDFKPLAGAMQVLHDDGVAVFVNGTKVFEKDLLFGTGHLVYGGTKVTDGTVSELNWGKINPFVAGENTVAVLVKQDGGGSSDLSFDLRLQVTPGAVSPLVPDPGPVAEPAPDVMQPPIAEPVSGAEI
ncbi:MAG: hypothetical protein ACI9OJ_000364, partial [Myxococcota bacterium]